MIAGVSLGTLGASITSQTIRFTSWTEIVRTLIQGTGTFFTIIWGTFNCISIETNSTFVALWSSCIVFTYL